MKSLFGFHETLEVIENNISELAHDATDVQETAHKEVKKKDCKYELLQRGEDEKIAGYVSNVQILFHLMKGCGETLTDKMIVEKAQTWKKHGGSNKFIGKRDKTQSKKSRSNPHKHKVDDRTYESLKRGERNTYQKDKEEKKGVKFYKCENCRCPCGLQDSVPRSGCSNHMIGQKVWLEDSDDLKKSKVNLANNSSLQAEGNVDIVIQRSNGVKAMIKYVLYVPGIKYNLLSVGQLVKKGFSVVMKDGALELFDT
ncbi:uncharacterized protein LOC131656930 [Vicia villosa]|uniref:uncharacterized protein LOC131656930 n=1 Tax=Vicia villosa TaxID=3911 RepID=UPI00273B7FC9|nr:uncharacterized protein LOC131656930 [Vicia villosa]